MAVTLAAVLERAQGEGLLGPSPVRDHVDHAMGFLPFVRPQGEVLDLGAGGGVPGLVLAEHLPHRRFALLDSSRRRAAFLAESVEALGLHGRVSVLEGRAETLGRDPAHRYQYSTVVARSFGPPAVVAECAAGFLEAGGRLVVSDPPGSPPRWDHAGLAALGLEVAEQVPGPPAFAVLVQRRLCPVEYPRGVGRPAKRPLWRESARST